MRGPEEAAAGTVLRRLIHGHLRPGPADAGPLGPQQQPAASAPQDGPQMPRPAARQEPQGEEQQRDGAAMEKQARAPPGAPGGEELPTYEAAKAQSQLFRAQPLPGAGGGGYLAGARPAARAQDAALRELKQGHVRSLSERLLRLSLARGGPRPRPKAGPGPAPAAKAAEPRGPPPEYPFKATPLAPAGRAQELGLLFADQHPGVPHAAPPPARPEVAVLHYQPPPEYGVTR